MGKLITSNSCWIKNTCRKYHKSTAECRTADVYCEKLHKLSILYDRALITEAQRKPIIFLLQDEDIDKLQFERLKAIENDIVNFVAAGKNIYIHSTICGNGKTAWSVRLLQDYINATWLTAPLSGNALFINVPRFLLALKDSITIPSEYVDHIKANALKADIVVWDEVATKSLTAYEHEHLLSLINTRLDEGKSNIYTSNLGPVELTANMGDRLASRIINLSEDIEFKGFDKRPLVSQ